MDDIELNQWVNVVRGKGYYDGEYYFSVHDTLFYIALRISQKEGKKGVALWTKVFHMAELEETYVFEIEHMIKKHLREHTYMGLVHACEEIAATEGEYFYNELMKVKNSRESLSLDEWNSLHVESFTTKDETDRSGYLSWDWKEVAECGRNTERRRRLFETCPVCGTRLIEVLVSTPGWSWRELCGREGMLAFCPHCQKQIKFNLERMN